MSKRVLGKVIYHDFSGGFWGIVSDKGIEYRPLNFPIQLKKEGVRVDIVVEYMNDEDGHGSNPSYGVQHKDSYDLSSGDVILVAFNCDL